MNDNKLPYISVIITAYNRKEFLLNAIKSALNQTLDKKYYEIIVIYCIYIKFPIKNSVLIVYMNHCNFKKFVKPSL